LLSCLLISTSFLEAQAPDTAWTKTLGGSADDVGRWVIENSGGDYIITGMTKSLGAGQNDAWLMKTDATGTVVWSQTYGGNNDDYSFTVQQTLDGGYVMGGQTLSYGAGGTDAWINKTDTLGHTDWAKTYGTSMFELGYSARQILDGGYIICSQTIVFGSGANDIWLIKTDSLGDTLWTRTYGGIHDDWGRFADQTSDSGYIVLGQTESFGAGNYDLYVIKTDAEGDTIWTKTYGTASSDYTRSMQQTEDDGFIILATSSLNSAGGHDAVLIKTDPNGDTLWTRSYGGTDQENGNFVQQTSDGGYILAGNTQSYGNGGYDQFIVRTDANGDTLWTKTMGGPGDDIGHCIQETGDGGYIVVGQTDSYGAGGDDLWLIKIEPDPTGITLDSRLKIAGRPFLYQNYPNPFNPTSTISWQLLVGSSVNISVYNLNGQRVAILVDEHQSAGFHQIEFDGSALASGVYLLRFIAGNFTATRKIILMK
jgi:regulation of enolase protein 1 (concanavalin A-like superfamily)